MEAPACKGDRKQARKWYLSCGYGGGCSGAVGIQQGA